MSIIYLYQVVFYKLQSVYLVTGAYYASAKIKHENYTEILLPDSVVIFYLNYMFAIVVQTAGPNWLTFFLGTH